MPLKTRDPVKDFLTTGEKGEIQSIGLVFEGTIKGKKRLFCGGNILGGDFFSMSLLDWKKYIFEAIAWEEYRMDLQEEEEKKREEMSRNG